MPSVHARHYATDQCYEIIYDDEGCHQVLPSSRSTELFVAPSFIDIQINGALGYSFNSIKLSLDQIATIVALVQSHGIGRFLPTLITGSYHQIYYGLTQLELARAGSIKLQRTLVGYHLEGPYISDEDGPRGAHPKEYLRDPDWSEFQRWQAAANGNIRLVTLAPERPKALAFIEKLTEAGVVAAIGHTAATPQQIRDAVRAGARLSTHLGNGSHSVLPRHENYFWEQLAHDGLFASIISDGHHLPPAILKSIIRGKTLDRLIVTCDASGLAGLPPGTYQEWNSTLEVLPTGKIIVAGTPFLAGSAQFTDQCLSHLLQQEFVTRAEAIELVTIQPARLFGWPIPKVQPGPCGSLLLFRLDGSELRVQRLI